MVDALKKLDKKFLIFVLIILLLPFLIVLFLILLRSCSTKMTYDRYEKKMEDAAIKYLKDNENEPIEDNEVMYVELATLVDKKYIKSTEKALEDSTCKGNIIVRRTGKTQDEDKVGYLNAIAVLNCEEYKTNTLIESVLKDLTSEGPGLYSDENGYVFKGETVNNYVTLKGKEYVILSIDSDGIFKLLRTENESLNQNWDMKYNIDVKESYGKNIYADSNILKSINKYYNNNKKVDESIKKKMVSYDVCIGKRSISDYEISVSKDCSTRLEHQPITLLNVSDFAKASLDPDCNSIVAKSCRNYNYLKSFAIGSWTSNASSDDSYNVFYLASGVISYKPASSYEYYNFVIYIDGNETVTGKGTKNAPYVIE